MEPTSRLGGFPGLLAPKLAPRWPPEAFSSALGGLLEGHGGDKTILGSPLGPSWRENLTCFSLPGGEKGASGPLPGTILDAFYALFLERRVL